MPEVVSSPLPGVTRPRLVGVTMPSSVVSLQAEPEILGFQYVLGLFPVSRLSTAHGVQLFLLESVLESLQLAGFDAVVVSADHQPDAVAALAFNHLIKTRIDDLAVNAYDALFFRILRVSGLLLVEEQSAQGDLRRSTALRIDESSYRSDGHAPTLAAMLKRSFSERFAASLRQLASPLRRHEPQDEIAGSPLVVLNLLRAPAALKAASTVIENSYGFPNALGYNERTLARLIQRGMQASLEKRSIASATTTLGVLPTGALVAPVWSLTGSIDELSIHEKLILGVTLQLDEIHPNGATMPVAKAHCRVTVPELDSLDGSWAFTAEQAAGTAVISFLERGEECSAQ